MDEIIYQDVQIDNFEDKRIKGDKNKRRTRSESGSERNYTCGCGKSYLSYPALYLHLKNKHYGISPSGTILPNNNTKRRNKDNEDMLVQKPVQNLKCLSKIISFIESIDSNLKRHIIPDINQPEFQNQILYDSFPKELFKNTNDYLIIYDNLKKLFDGEHLENENQYQDNIEIKTTTLDKILALFLYKICVLVSFQCFREIAYFICIFRLTLNKLGWDILEKQNPLKAEQQKILKNQNTFTELNNAEYALDICNDFILDYLPLYLEQTPNSDFKLLGQQQPTIKNNVYLTQHFCDWLFDNSYTNSKLTITNDMQN